tara:strand:+ start:56 stop:976 length:921 start_codon:yes stop_codon:yes gene_type:complete
MAPNITFGGSRGNPLLDANWGNTYGGNNVTYRPGGGNNVALAGGGLLGQWSLSTVMDDLGRRLGPTGTALKETLLETGQKAGANLPGTVGKTQGLIKSTAQTIAPKAYSRAATASSAAGTKAAMDIMRQGGGAYAAQRAAQVAGIKAGGKIAGKYLTNRVPFIGAGISLATGDPLGAAGTLAGGAIGSLIAPGIGTVIGSTIGGPIAHGIRNVGGRFVGLGTPGDPLSGSEHAVLFGVPLSPYAKTLKNEKRRLDLWKRGEGALLQEANERQMEREMKLMQLGMLQNQMQSGAAAISQIMANNPYT